MSGKAKKGVKDLEDIIRALADVWPTDRDNVAIAGAKFEEIIESFDKNVGQLQKLIDLAWEGLKHLYEKDEYFMSVKAATMQAVNTIREYLLKEGNIEVKDFEKACSDLDKSLSGAGESADTIIELDDETIQSCQKEKETEAEAEPEQEAVSLDDLASFILSVDEESIKEDDLDKLSGLLESLSKSATESVSIPLKEAFYIVAQVQSAADDYPKGWLMDISAKTEKAIEIEADEDWQQSVGGKEEKVIPTGEEAVKTAEREGATESGVFHIPEDVEVAMMGEFITECTELIEMAEIALLDLEETPNNEELINTVFRAFHTIKGTSAFMGLDPISEFTHSVETLLSMVREGELSFDAACADITLESIDVIKQMLVVVETAAGGDPLPEPGRYQILLDVLDNVCDEGVEPKTAVAALPKNGFSGGVNENDTLNEKSAGDDELAEDGSADKGVIKSESESSVRVNVSRLDRLIDMVGELVIAHSVVAQDKAIPKDTELQKKVNHTTKILRELQDTSLTLRMVPLKATFHKMNRLVRDISRKAGKSIMFATFDEYTEIAHNMIHIMSQPLVHRLINAIDHGVEDPETREDKGKPETANIWLRASQEGGKVVIDIEDDGRGIDKDKILKKAVSKGLVDPERKLTESEIYNLIFLPGFSSVEKVTDLSGRGVGMDVVRRAIEQLQGKVEVSSELGKGTKISLELPFTLAITDGMLVKVGTERFIVPTINIDMTFRAGIDDLYTVLGNSEQVSFRGQSVPVVRLHKLFEIEDGKEDLLEGTMLIIKNNNKRYALLVDEVVGQQQLVGKSINMLVKMHHISGGAILGDGRVGLILDTATLMN